MAQMVKVKMVGNLMIHHPVAGSRSVWPLDQFTLRRIADKDIEIVEGETEKPVAQQQSEKK